MPVFALYNFNDNTTVVDDAPLDGDQNGIYLNGASASGGQLRLDGINDFAKIFPADTFQMDRGTLDIKFTPTGTDLSAPQTVLSRDSTGETPGGFHIDVNPDGSISVVHESAGDTTSFTTEPDFYSSGDTINVVYSWDEGGTGGSLQIKNMTDGGSYETQVPDTLTMDMGGESQPWMVGTGQGDSDPNELNNLGPHFEGSVQYFSLSDTVDNGPADADPTANPDTATTDEDTPVIIDVLSNDTDPNGDPLEVTHATSPNGTVVIEDDGRLTYTPNPDFNGSDTITYTITDPDGNTSTSTVNVTVNPVNDNPDANNDNATTNTGTPVVIFPLLNDTDPDHDTLSIVGTPTSADGTVQVNDDGSVTFTPDDGFIGTTTIEYEVSDGNGGTDTATITVVVGPAERDGIVRGTDGGDLINGGYVDPWDGDRVDANDAIIAGDGPNDDRIRAGGGNDTIYAGIGNDTVWAGSGNDLVFGGSGNDDLRGNNGDDTFTGGSGNDTIWGQRGDDVINTSAGPQLPDIDYPGLYPADPNPNDDRDLAYGGHGADTISTGDDADTIYGGMGNDNIDSGVDADSVVGGHGADTIIASEGADTVFGGRGDDLIYGGLGPIGNDILDIPDADGDLRPDNNTDLLYGGRGSDTIYGRDDDDTLFGGYGNDVLYGGVDEDVLHGNMGNDTLQGGEGADSLYGGGDRDLFIVGTQGDGIGDFIDGRENGDDWDTLDLSGAGPLHIDYDPTNPENGTVTFYDGSGNVTGTLNFINIENVIPCFTPGTRIATPTGEVAVESLKAGDKVITRDNGIQEIRWIGQKALTGADLQRAPHLQPVLIKAGTFGPGLPERDMLVSPNHRMLVANDRTQLYFDEHEVLVAAKHLVGMPGVHAVRAIATTYIHFMCDRHEVVLSNGAWTESFQPGDYTLKGMGEAQRGEIFELFPGLQTTQGLEDYQAARRTLKRHEARLLAR